MKIFGLFAASALAANFEDRKEKLDARHNDFLALLEADGSLNGFARKFKNKIEKLVEKIPMDQMGVEGCMNEWGLPDEADAPFDPESATKCEYARKIARSYYRWAQMNVCLDDVSNRQKATITRKYENVINYMWAHKLCEDETPDKPE